jgi:hypothetical protein
MTTTVNDTSTINDPVEVDEAPVYTGRTVGTKEQLGVGVIALGILALLLPWAANAIGDLDFIKAEPYGILAGSVMVLGLFIIGAGIAVVAQRLD